MGLTSKKLELLIAALAVLCFVVTAWLWPRLGRRNWRALLGRFGMLLGSQALSLAAIGLLANNWGGFYSSWSDLLGTDGGAAPAIVSHAPDARAGRIVVHGRRSVPLELPGQSPSASGGTLQRVTIHSAGTGLTEPGYVYLPPQYRQRAYAHYRFPVMLVFTGYPGTPRNLISRMKYPTVAARAIYRHRMQPTVLVLMRPSVAMPRDTECQNVPHGPQTLTFFAEDLHRAMVHAYRVSAAGSAWGVIGDSTGGYCALSLALREPTAFTAAASLSGYYDAIEDHTTGHLFGRSKKLKEHADLFWRVDHLPPVPVSLLVASSRKGEADYRSTLAFIKAVRAHPPLSVSSLILPSGGHNFRTWNRETPSAVPWVADRLAVPDNPIPLGGGSPSL